MIPDIDPEQVAAWPRSRRVETYDVRGGTAAWIASGRPVTGEEVAR